MFEGASSSLLTWRTITTDISMSEKSEVHCKSLFGWLLFENKVEVSRDVTLSEFESGYKN